MWKMLAIFIVFAGVALTFIFKAGDKIDMQGEAAGHNPTESHASAPDSAPPALPNASAKAN